MRLKLKKNTNIKHTLNGCKFLKEKKRKKFPRILHVRFYFMAKTSSTKEFSFAFRIFLNFFLYLKLFISEMCNYLCRIYFHPTNSKFVGNFVYNIRHTCCASSIKKCSPNCILYKKKLCRYKRRKYNWMKWNLTFLTNLPKTFV